MSLEAHATLALLQGYDVKGTVVATGEDFVDTWSDGCENFTQDCSVQNVESYFATCERDEGGRCMPLGSGVRVGDVNPAGRYPGYTVTAVEGNEVKLTDAAGNTAIEYVHEIEYWRGRHQIDQYKKLDASLPPPITTDPGQVTEAVRVAWAEGLSEEERRAVEYWSRRGNLQIRALQAGIVVDPETGKRMSSKHRAIRRAFESAMDAAPTYDGTVYRGISVDKAGAFDTLLPGAIVKWGVSTSTSKDLNTAAEFVFGSDESRIMLEIRQKSGADVSKAVASLMKSQREVVLPKGASYRVLSVDDREHPIYRGATDIGFDDEHSFQSQFDRLDMKPTSVLRVRHVVMEEV